MNQKKIFPLKQYYSNLQMKNISKVLVYIFAFIFFFATNNYAQYEIKSEYLVNPEKIKAHVDSCAQFWLPTYDDEYGGFYQGVARDGSITDQSKTMLGQTRTAYGMVKAFMLSGDTTYLSYARGALNFMYKHAWDSANSGWFNELEREGNVKPNGERNNDKWVFMQHYALLGIAAIVEATQNDIDWQFLLNGRYAVDQNLWDNRIGYEGYYENSDVDWSNPSGKGFTPSMDGITTHLLNLYLISRDEQYKERLLAVADNVIDFILPAMDHFSYGYPESYTSDWEPDLNNTYVFTGHFLKSAWCLTRAYLIDPKPEYLDFSTTILNEVIQKGFDEQYGAVYANYNGATGSRYGTDREWWQLEQAFTAGIMNYYISGEEKYLQFADENLDYYMKNFVDREHGEVYTNTSRNGSVSNSAKAHYWKAGYHSIELGYYVYLYGNLYLHYKPVTLYYCFKPIEAEREFSLYPLAIENSKLKITNVELNNEPYSNYSPDSRVLKIPAETGGIFAVTFENKAVTSVAVNDGIEKDFTLHQNYPNPFNPITSIEYQVAGSENVTLKVYDLLGREVELLVDKVHSPGTYKIKFDASELPSGVYFYRMRAGNFTQTRKMMVIK